MVDGASLLPISNLGHSWAPAELPSVKQMGSQCTKVDEEVVDSSTCVAADHSVIGVDVGNLAFNSNGVTGLGVEDTVPCEVDVELHISMGEEGL